MKLYEKENKKIGEYIFWFLIVIVSIPLILGAIIPIESTIINFSDSNDWIGFWGSYIGGILGGLCTLIVMYFTRKDTRDIQNQNLKILKYDRINSIKPIIDIDTPNCLFVHYKIDQGEKYKNIIIKDLVFDKESRFKVDDKYQSFVKVINLSQSTVAKNFEIEIKCTRDDILKAISRVEPNLREKKAKDGSKMPNIYDFNSCKIVYAFNDEIFVHKTKLRFLNSKAELFLNLEFLLRIELRDIIKIMLCAVIDNSKYEEDKNKTVLYKKELFVFEVNLKYQDIDSYEYTNKFEIKVSTKMVTDISVCIDLDIELLEKKEPNYI